MRTSNKKTLVGADIREAHGRAADIAAHVVVGFRAMPTEATSGPARFVLDFGCGGFALLVFLNNDPPYAKDTITWGTRHMENPCEHCTMLRLVAQANNCAPADAENYLE